VTRSRAKSEPKLKLVADSAKAPRKRPAARARRAS